MAGRNITNPTTYGTLPASPPPSNTSLFDGSFSPLYGVVTDSGNWTNYGVDTGVVNAYAMTLTPAASSYQPGMVVFLKPNNTNTDVSTININGLGSITIQDSKGNAVQPGAIPAGFICPMVYTGTAFRLFLPPYALIKNIYQVSASPQAVDCTGASEIMVSLSTSGATTMVLQLNNIMAGAHVDISFANFGPGTVALTIQATSSGSVSYGVAYFASGSSQSFPLNVVNGGGFLFQGAAGLRGAGAGALTLDLNKST